MEGQSESEVARHFNVKQFTFDRLKMQGSSTDNPVQIVKEKRRHAKIVTYVFPTCVIGFYTAVPTTMGSLDGTTTGSIRKRC